MKYENCLSKGIIAIFAIICFSYTIHAEDTGIAINDDKSAPNQNAILDIKSSSTDNGKGLLIPRITEAQRTNANVALAGGLLDDSGDLRGAVAAQGLLVYQTDGTQGFYYNTSITSTPTWVYLGAGSGTVKSIDTGTGLTGGTITSSGTISIADNGVTETQLNTSVAGDGLTGGGGTALAVAVDDASIEVNGDALRLKDSGVAANTYKSVTVDTKGRVTAGSNPTTIAAFGITDAVGTSRTVASGNGLTGGGDLSADRTLAVGDGAGITVNADDVAVNVDDSTIEINGGDNLQIKANGVSVAKISSGAATSGQMLSADGSGNTAWSTPVNIVKTKTVLLSEAPVNTNLSGYTIVGKVDCDFYPKTGTNAASTWTATTTSGAPTNRYFHCGVWTGQEMIVWGGYSGGNLNTGGKYNPITDSWIATSTTSVPAARYYNTAIWTGSEMIIWGGGDASPTNNGGRYNPSSNIWSTVSTTNAPEARSNHTAVWTGSEMIVWGGNNGSSYINTGGRYNPTSDSWIATSIGANVPSGRSHYTAVWTDSEMIVWGGWDGASNFNTGGRLAPSGYANYGLKTSRAFYQFKKD